MDSNIQNLPAVLHNIRFHEAHGPLIEANRGLLEFSDMLKRPVEAFKYLLTTVEKAVIDLPSSTANLDVVFFGTTNEKHLDAFKTLPDFASFRSRFELVTVPYLLTAREEERIYDRDVKAIGKLVKITPHSLRLLCIWAVMTRLKQPDPEYYDSKHRALIARLDPRSKLGLYEGESLKRQFTSAEETVLRELRSKIIDESRGVLIYEGRFGASPREIRGLLHRAAQNPKFPTLTPMAIFAELDRLIKDRTVYEFLQFEPRGKYHDAAAFIKVIKDEFVRIFENEVVRSMTLVEQAEYDALLQRYVDNVVAFVKKEKIYNSGTGSYEAPNENVMKEVERVLGVSGSVDRHREGMLGRIAAWKLDHRNEVVDVKVVFDDVMRKIEDHYHAEKKKLVDANFRAMLLLDGEEERNLKELERDLARTTYEQLEKRFGYDKASARECLKFIMTFKQG